MTARIVRTALIANVLGLHLRAANKLVQLAAKFPCDIVIGKDGHEVNGKSIMGLMMLVAGKGSTLTIGASGERAQEAVDAIVQLVDDKFGED